MTWIERIIADLFSVLSAIVRSIRVIRVLLTHSFFDANTNINTNILTPDTQVKPLQINLPGSRPPRLQNAAPASVPARPSPPAKPARRPHPLPARSLFPAQRGARAYRVCSRKRLDCAVENPIFSESRDLAFDRARPIG